MNRLSNELVKLVGNQISVQEYPTGNNVVGLSLINQFKSSILKPIISITLLIKSVQRNVHALDFI